MKIQDRVKNWFKGIFGKKKNTPAPKPEPTPPPAPKPEPTPPPVPKPAPGPGPGLVIVDNIYMPDHGPDVKCPDGYVWCGMHTNCLKYGNPGEN